MVVEDKLNEKSRKIQEEINYNYAELVKEQKRTIKLYEEYLKFLEHDYINAYEEALDNTLEENIALKKKLKAY